MLHERGKQRQQVGGAEATLPAVCPPPPSPGAALLQRRNVTALLGRCLCDWLCPQQSLWSQGPRNDSRHAFSRRKVVYVSGWGWWWGEM